MKRHVVAISLSCQGMNEEQLNHVWKALLKLESQADLVHANRYYVPELEEELVQDWQLQFCDAITQKQGMFSYFVCRRRGCNVICRAMDWLNRTSRTRAWWPTQGHEWRLIAASGRSGTAFHVLKVLAGGVRGTAGTRSAAARRAHRRRCLACHALDPCWVWTTPCEAADGVA